MEKLLNKTSDFFNDIVDLKIITIIKIKFYFILSGQYVFDCLAITNMTTTTSLINGINITDWKQRAVMLDSDQEITGTWNIKGAVNFTHPVNDLVSLGNVNLHDRADQIKTQILDVELQMKVIFKD